jgi:hypothetical protein
MTTDGTRRPGERAQAVDAGAHAHAHGRRAAGGPTTAARVVPLWERPRAEVRG